MLSDCVVLGVAFALNLAAVGGKNPGPYSRSHYKGPSYNAQIALYYKGNLTQPKCYAAMVNFDVLVAPCSCVVKEPVRMATWWDHRVREKVQADDPSNYKALVMTFEYAKESVKNKLLAPVKKIEISPQCDTLFQYNVARLELGKTIERTKLAWVANPFEKRMKRLLQYAEIGTAVRGACSVYRWSTYDDWDTKVGGARPPPTLIEYDVSMDRWSSCRDLVCPTYVIPPNNVTRHQDEKICQNQVTGSRLCAQWDVAIPFCDVVPGTPVFCRVGALTGLVGFVHNAVQFCLPDVAHKFAVMEGIDLALPLIKCDLRIVNAMPDKMEC